MAQEVYLAYFDLLGFKEFIGNNDEEHINLRMDHFREQLLDIKTGNMDYDDLLVMADRLMESIESYSLTSTLPNAPDKDLVERVLVEMRKELYK